MSFNVLPRLRWLSPSFTCHADASHLLPTGPIAPPLHSPVACAASPWIGVRWVCCSCVSPTCMSPYKATHTPVPLHIHSAWPEMGNQCVRGPNYWPAIYPVPLQQPSEVCACFSGRESCFNIVRLMVKWEWADIESTLEHFACLPSAPTIAAHCNPSLVLRYVAVRSRPQCSESLAERERVGCEHLWYVHPTLSGMRLRRGRARGGGRTGGWTRRCIPNTPTS